MQIINKKNNPLPFEIRKVQSTTRCLMLSLPKKFTDYLAITKGDLLKIQLEKNMNPDSGGKIVLSKIDVANTP
jgi:hypothetical protein